MGYPDSFTWEQFDRYVTAELEISAADQEEINDLKETLAFLLENPEYNAEEIERLQDEIAELQEAAEDRVRYREEAEADYKYEERRERDL